MKIIEWFYPVYHNEGYWLCVFLVALGWAFHLKASRIIGSNLYWEEIEFSVRLTLLCVAVVTAFIPYVNIFFLGYFLVYYCFVTYQYFKHRKANKALHDRIMEQGRQVVFARQNPTDYAAKVVEVPTEPVNSRPYDRAEIIRSELITDPMSTFGYVGQEAMMERYLQKVLAHVHRDLCKKAGVMPYLTADKAQRFLESAGAGEGVVQELWAELMAHYRRLDMRLFQFYGSGEYNKGTTHSLMKRVEHLAHVIANGILIVLPDQLYTNIPESVKEIHRYYPEVAVS